MRDNPSAGKTLSQQAWTAFWSGAAGSQGGCLPRAHATQQTLRPVWQEFANELRPGSRVLDLATGNGAVLLQLAQCRRHLRLFGVDYSTSLKKPPAGMVLKSASLERLPFKAGSFDAATSQFGIEYADVALAAAELGRVLKDDAKILFVVHHKGGILVADNGDRLAALRWSLDRELIDRARRVANARRTFPMPTPPEFLHAGLEARRAFPDDDSAEATAGAIFDTLQIGRAAGPDRTLEALDEIESRIREEMILLASMQRAARDERGMEELRNALSDATIETTQPTALGPPGAPLAWALAGRKRAAP